MKPLTTIHIKADKLAESLGIPVEKVNLADGRTANNLVGLAITGKFERFSDGASGYLIKVNDRTLRLRAANKKVELSPSANRGVGREFDKKSLRGERNAIDGFAVFFTRDMPNPPIYEISLTKLKELQAKGFLDNEWKGTASRLYAELTNGNGTPHAG